MAVQTTYARLRENLAAVLDQVVDNQEIVIVRRRGSADVALVPAAELSGLQETAYLLRSPANAKRLLAASRRAERRSLKPAIVPTQGGAGLKSGRDAVFDLEFLGDLRYFVDKNRKTALRILDLVEAVLRDPFRGVGQPELLRHDLAGRWSRRIDQEHRLVYRVAEDRIDFLQARYHY
jgi:toxin YoeB